MLLSIAITNYRSFSEEAVLDLQRRGFKTLRPRGGETWRDNTWRRAAVFGANASGKSNILRPLSLLRDAVFRSLTGERFVAALRDPHRLSLDRETSFEVEYVADDVHYRWLLVLDNAGVVKEKLEAVERVRFIKLFERTRNDIEFGQQSGLPQAAKGNIEQFMRNWSLVFSAWDTVKSPGKHIAAVDWWRFFLPLIDGEGDQVQRHRWLIDLAQENVHWLTALTSILRVADVGVINVDVRKEDAPPAVEQVLYSMSQKAANDTQLKVDAEAIEQYLRYLEFEHESDGASFSLHEEDESQGTKTWMDVVVPALFALTLGGVLTVDEIGLSLHPLLVRQLVSYFDDPELNPSGAQLLFTSHDTSLIGKQPDEVLHRGEVWFVDKQSSRSELIALDEFPVRSAHNIEKRYLQGSYGAVPIPDNAELVRTLDELRRSYTDLSRTR
ncbi:AAA family ATPase [Corynebacterium liangguodongii]|uniref:Phage resistance protein n=1 Tax=Corynebacterium liangguodongii TaxID=2079535 RepID=A0A2S0WBP1_9CORY|nr:ATP-binding protein [Corynebacterium liangguodongii]AWB83186.1 phage resistance protein [Corynebacterium liangguodongii]PWB98781.1 ATP-binding protein [Corynebacterium liangguodongii]